MVKGISRQVIVVHAPDPQLFEEAIFILKDSAVESGGISEEALLREARHILRGGSAGHKRQHRYLGPAWACGGALLTGMVWLLTVLL